MATWEGGTLVAFIVPRAKVRDATLEFNLVWTTKENARELTTTFANGSINYLDVTRCLLNSNEFLE
jgi:hypothetical protein